MYEKYLGRRRNDALKLLEIGLGCDMHYGPGASATLWRKYLPHAEIWFAEFDSDCVNKQRGVINALNVSVVTGDQGNAETAERGVKESNAGFDVINRRWRSRKQSDIHLIRYLISPRFQIWRNLHN